jgi:hypothetical protein
MVIDYISQPPEMPAGNFIPGEGDLSVFRAGEQMSRFSGFDEVVVGDEDGVFNAEGPEAVVITAAHLPVSATVVIK